GEQVGMRLCVDLALEDSLRPRDRDRGHLAAQLVARAVHRLLDVRLGLLDLALALARRVALGLAQDLVVARVRLVDDLDRLGARLAQDLLRLLPRALEIALAALA